MHAVVDHRPRALEISAFTESDREDLLPHFAVWHNCTSFFALDDILLLNDLFSPDSLHLEILCRNESLAHGVQRMREGKVNQEKYAIASASYSCNHIAFTRLFFFLTKLNCLL